MMLPCKIPCVRSEQVSPKDSLPVLLAGISLKCVTARQMKLKQFDMLE